MVNRVRQGKETMTIKKLNSKDLHAIAAQLRKIALRDTANTSFWNTEAKYYDKVAQDIAEFE